ncbi:aldehyde reductase II [Fusarium albosuccineum]|uniref:Aldehyde reductase II n=1 Tax=Fusarium albosuccineum TaxID=1237068 RepID=A0A8H4LA10_9HYPO|nr:aldehyde reductase II [Fusarium albosuccineum]
MEHIPTSQVAIPIGELIAVSGANGSMGSHICNQLLSLGYPVRGIVRSKERSAWLVNYLTNNYRAGLFELAEVPDMTIPGACDEAIAGAAGVIHVAADTSLELDPEVVVPRIIATTMGIAESAAKSLTCKRFVYTSSSSAVSEPEPGVRRTLTPATFNDEVIRLAYSKGLPGGIVGGHTVYAAGKTRAEQELWNWYHETSPQMVLNVVIPSPCFGAVLSPEKQGYSAANRVLKMLWDGDSSDDVANALIAQWFCDVKDVSTLHVGALLLDQVKSERLFAYAARCTINDILGIFRNLSPGKTFRGNVVDVKPDLTDVPNKTSSEVLEVLGLARWTTLQECLALLVKQWSELAV